MNNFRKFKLYSVESESVLNDQRQFIVLNLDHIVSIKPINIATSRGVLKAFWLRLTNGKKYKAVEIPEDLSHFFDSEDFNQIDVTTDEEILLDIQ